MVNKYFSMDYTAFAFPSEAIKFPEADLSPTNRVFLIKSNQHICLNEIFYITTKNSVFSYVNCKKKFPRGENRDKIQL